MAFDWTITTAGAAALAAAHQASTDFALDRVEFGEGQYVPTGSEVALNTPFSPVRSFTDPSGFTDGSKVTLVFEDSGNDGYGVGEVGIFSGSTLYAIASRPTPLLFSKVANVPRQFAAFFTVSGDEIGAVTFNAAPDVPNASETMRGIVQLATPTDIVNRTGGGVITAETLPAGELPTVTQANNGQILIVSNGAWAIGIGLPAGSITSGTIAVARIPDLGASKITSGTLDASRIPIATSTQLDAATPVNTHFITPHGLAGSSLYGRAVRSGTADPDNSVGVDGDLYLQRSS